METKELFELTNPQKNILNTEIYFSDTNVNNLCVSAILNEVVNFDVLKKAINILVQKNDSFRIQLCVVRNKTKQTFCAFEPFDIEVIDANSDTDFASIERETVKEKFKLLNSNLFKFKLVKFSDGRGGIILNVHHIIADSWSLGITVKETVKIYHSLMNGDSEYISDTFSYKNLILSEQDYKNSNRYKDDKVFWNKYLKDFSEPVSIPSIFKDTYANTSNAKRQSFNIDTSLVKQISNFCAKNRISNYVFFMSIFSLYIANITNVDDLIIGTPILNRLNYKDKSTTGMFVTTMPFRIHFNENISFIDFALKNNINLVSLFRHQRYPYSNILKDIRKSVDIANLYNVSLSYQITKAVSDDIGNYETNWIFNNNSSNDFSIHIHDVNNTGNLIINYDYLTDKYHDNDVANVHYRVLNMIQQILSNNDILCDDIEIITSEEKEMILNNFNNTTVNYSSNKTIIDLFEEQVDKTPNNIAIVANDESLTFEQLNERSNQLANHLLSLGVKNNDVVGIMVNRSIEMVVGLLAILKSGAAYLPIDPEYPLNRISYMLENSNSKLVLLNENTYELLDSSFKKVNISFNNELYTKNECKNLNINILPSQLMYLIYTSGSTGKPKGVMLTHDNVHNFIIGVSRHINFSPDKTMVSLTTISFDIFVLELWCSLVNGLKVVIANETEQKDIASFNELCIKNNVSMIQTTPSRFLAFLEDKNCLDYLKNITDIMVGGESLPESLLTSLKKYSNANIYNMYGPTETTVWSTVKDLTDDNDITIGKPISNTQCYILNNKKKLLPPYSIGDLYIGGLGVSKGYWGNEKLTEEKFITLNNGSRAYNTNDLAYYTKQGEIVHLGRADFQVKIRGYRIELGEIENAISSFDNILSCAVVCHEIDGKQILCAYYTSSKDIIIDELKASLLKILPAYMIPSYYIHMNKLPYTPNGKLDRKSLTFDYSQINKDIVLPKNEIEQQLYDIVSSIINNTNFSMEEDLFSLGMDSIEMIHFTYRIEQVFNLTISIKDLYNSPSLVDLANVIENTPNTNVMHIEKAPKSDSYPLSSSQKEMFYASQMDKNTTVYNVSCGFLVDSVLDKEKIQNAFRELILQQSSLRTSFKIINGEPRQVVLEDINFNVEFFDDFVPNKQKIVDNFPKPFDLSCAPLFRVAVYNLENKKTLILIDSHHIVMDGTSLSILLKDFCNLYCDKSITASNTEYIDYTMWENEFINSSEISDIENYWISKFKTNDLPILNLPYDYSVTNVKSFNGNSIDIPVSKNIFDRVVNLSKEYKISPYTFFISVFYILLYKYTGQTDIIIGSPTDLRRFSELNNVIGMFVNNVLFRNNLNTNEKFSEFLCKTQNLIKQALTNQPYPYDRFITKLNLNTSSLLDVVFAYQTPHNETFGIDNSSFDILRPHTSTSKFNLLLEVVPDMNIIRLEYNTDLFKFETAESILKHYIFILSKLLNNQNKKLSDINIITTEEKKLLTTFNSTNGPINSDTVVSIFESEVKKNPNNIALICEDKSLTYDELNKKANSLAHHLIKRGIGRNDKVCIMTNRSLETIVCMLGILKAGAAFFNVDPTYPIERTKYYLEDSKTKYVLTQNILKDRVSEIENCIEIDLTNKDIYNKNFDNPNVKILPSDLSYIIYTSGSTGTPKGVMLNQVGFANMAKAMTKVLDYLKEGNKHTIVSVTSTPFDIFVYEIFVSLTHGLKVVMANNAEHRNPKLLDALIRKYNVDVMTVTPSLMKINYDNREPNSALSLVKNMVFGGEPLPEKFVKDLKSLSDDITIYNIYGPSEITILSNVQNLDGESEITVGPPIMNTKIYILDTNMKPVPIGVTGEIYISGIQVGLGYIGKPEMTASRFLDNPFGTGKIYKSGDIGRWTFDGKIQCLGRIDNQIKLRGLRIELGEIENIISNIPGISSSVVNKIEMDGKEVLCGYYVSDSTILEQDVKQVLKKALPPYMVPTYVIRLDEMPYTINRKIDRKALPLPNLKRSIPNTAINIEDLNTNEEKLLQIWKNILKIDDITTTDNFFDIGGDSISAIQMQIEAIKYGLSFEYADIFNYPTIKELSNKLPNSEINFIEDYDYNKINSVLSRNTIDNFSSIVPAKISDILLIGSTGFLGAHVIDEYMKQNDGVVYCLVRKKNNLDPSTRLKQILKFYFGEKYISEFTKRIRIVEGDITKDNLGLSDYDYNLIKNNVDVIINSGAIVKHYGLKKEFEDINVHGTKNVVKFCKNENKRLLHISTMSVSGSGEKEEAIEENSENINYKKQFSETNLFVGQKLKGVYTTTKYRAELLVLEAIYDGLNAQILRLGNITNRYSDGVFQQNVDDNAFAKRIKSFIQIGATPKYMLKHSIELTPVDLAADAIIKIMNYNSNCNVFHIFNTKLMPITLLLETLNELNYEILPMSNDMFASLITGILVDNNKKDSLSGIIYDLDDKKKLIYTYGVRLHADFTSEYLKHIHFDWQNIDKDYIIRYMNYFKKINFIPGGNISE